MGSANKLLKSKKHFTQ